jgi:hypothetical protein
MLSVWDAQSRYWQSGMTEESKCLTQQHLLSMEVYMNLTDCRSRKSFGNSFCRCIPIIIQPICDTCFPYFDDMSHLFLTRTQHPSYLRFFLWEIYKSGLTLSLQKCSSAQNKVCFGGHINGSGTQTRRG